MIPVVDEQNVLGLEVGVYQVQVMQDYRPSVFQSVKPTPENLHATLVSSCRAKLWIWLLGNGAKILPFKKSKTLIPNRSVTMPMFTESVYRIMTAASEKLTDMISVVKTIPQMDALVLVVLVIKPQCRQHA